MVFIKLLLLFTLLPALELFLVVGSSLTIGVWHTLGIILLTGVIGSWVARSQGLATWRRIREALSRGQLPARDMVHGVLILLAGALLITPGFITDLTGFLLLMPPFRTLIARTLRRRFEKGLASGKIHVTGRFHAHVGRRPSHDARSGEVIDVEARDATDRLDDGPDVG